MSVLSFPTTGEVRMNANRVRKGGAIVVVGAQWGDEGKGKIVDILAQDADLVGRFQGGNNAGHTLVVDGHKVVLHIVPSGALQGKPCVIGHGVVVDPTALDKELGALNIHTGHSMPPVFVSSGAAVITPLHKMLDAARESGGSGKKLGTTLRGIGPCYESRARRTGMHIRDLLGSYEQIKGRLQVIAREVEALSAACGASLTVTPKDIDTMTEALFVAGVHLRERIVDTVSMVNQALVSGQAILCEGAQGAMLDVLYGTYPFVTSSNTVAGNACVGLGFGPTWVRNVTAVVKAYTTRVGEGPFPTEDHGAAGELLRQKGAEFGATTGRPRRCGWLDLPQLRYSLALNGATEIALTKLDVLSGIGDIPVCTAYECGHAGGRQITVIDDPTGLDGVVPIYTHLSGWNEDISGVRCMEDLPVAAHGYIDFIEDRLGVPVKMVSVGPGRHQTFKAPY